MPFRFTMPLKRARDCAAALAMRSAELSARRPRLTAGTNFALESTEAGPMDLPDQFRIATTLSVALSTSLAVAVCAWAGSPGQEPARVKQVRGVDIGSSHMIVFVARDKPTWDAVKQAAGPRHEFPRAALKGDELASLDPIDFQKEMIVAVFWGEMNFSGHDEKCWIEAVSVGDDEITVDCRASLWGGDVTRSYRAWPYDVKVVRRSELPVTFEQTTEIMTKPDQSEKEKPLATLKPGEWKREITPPK
jgi:hypothetical protein